VSILLTYKHDCWGQRDVSPSLPFVSSESSSVPFQGIITTLSSLVPVTWQVSCTTWDLVASLAIINPVQSHCRIWFCERTARASPRVWAWPGEGCDGRDSEQGFTVTCLYSLITFTCWHLQASLGQAVWKGSVFPQSDYSYKSNCRKTQFLTQQTCSAECAVCLGIAQWALFPVLLFLEYILYVVQGINGDLLWGASAPEQRISWCFWSQKAD